MSTVCDFIIIGETDVRMLGDKAWGILQTNNDKSLIEMIVLKGELGTESC